MLSYKIKYDVPPGVEQRAFNNAVKAELLTVGQFWVRHMLKRHFTHRGASQYRYQRRSPVYNLRKRKRHGHDYPLVNTGELQRQVMQNATVRSTFKQVRISLPGPRHMNYRGKGRLLTPAEELKLITDNEANRELAPLLREAVARAINRFKQPETRTL